MSKGKLQKFAELATFPNVFQNFSHHQPELINYRSEKADLKGRWNQFFGNKHPITLELACGRGEYTLAMARRTLTGNFIGVDIKGARIWKGAKTALEENLRNVAFVRTEIEFLDHFFASGEIAEIWITFPDPFPRKSRSGKRLTSPRFLDIYQKILQPGGFIHLKTDSELLFDFTLEMIRDRKLKIHQLVRDVYSEPHGNDLLYVKTYYENLHLAEGHIIRYVRFSLEKDS